MFQVKKVDGAERQKLSEMKKGDKKRQIGEEEASAAANEIQVSGWALRYN